MKPLNNILTVRSTLLATVFVLVLLAALITMGLLTPFILRVSTGEEILLDSAYFNLRAALPTLALVMLLTLCLLIRSAGKEEGLLVLGIGTVGSVLSVIFSPFSSLPVNIAFPLLAAAFFAVVYRLLSLREKTLKGTLRRAGSHIIHLGAVLLLVGILFSTNMKLEDSAVVPMGEVGTFKSMGYSVYVTNITSGIEGDPYGSYPGSAYVSTIDFDVYRWGQPFDSGQIRYISDFKWEQSYTETYIHRGLLEELFIAPKSVDTKAQTVELYIRKVPFMTALWGGFYLMVLGILILFLSDSLLREKGTSGDGLSGNRSSEISYQVDENKNANRKKRVSKKNV
ncbi:MAG: cytochrome c-type biogenesis CcmF C-terminal domain-containing protein [Methanosarcina sp.]|uniref:cytochrome c-type biogenesis CcmF C-terminal domain-containing protein n=1 Tax=Methanosarcina sp. TaxID=2213 RepID=UPI002615681C|nr:cytochrome c-type biogenesis CcmF C-terminal domain-containing protein [Methanosarcina sp.]MDD3247948.1 cytochrome c-type biogenesis CcmF C-terminal domain-containing protein [Methanosarcina sp.]